MAGPRIKLASVWFVGAEPGHAQDLKRRPQVQEGLVQTLPGSASGCVQPDHGSIPRIAYREGKLMVRSGLLLVLGSALLLSACASSGSYADREGRRHVCAACGVVERLARVERSAGYASGSGAVLGAIIGGTVGNRVGEGDGRAAATIAGAVAGGVVGHEIEKNRIGGIWYEMLVRFDDGSRRVIRQRARNGIRAGDRVRVEGGIARLL